MGEVMERSALVKQLFADYDVQLCGQLSAQQLQLIYEDMRLGGLSLQQVKASVEYVCIGDKCEVSELFDVLQEMDRRYFLVQNLRWEFSMLDTDHTNTISEMQARWLTQAVHGNVFSKRKWEKFLLCRLVPGSGVSFSELEVLLCHIPSIQELSGEEEEERREAQERARKQREMERLLEAEKEKRRKQRDEERKRQEAADKKRAAEEDHRRKEEEAERKRKLDEAENEEARRKKLAEEEERGRLEAEERERREKQKQEEDEQKRLERNTPLAGAQVDIEQIIQAEQSGFFESWSNLGQVELLEVQRLRELEERHRREEEERRKKEEAEAKGDEEKLKKAQAEEDSAEQEAQEARKRLKEAKDGRAKQEAEEAEKTALLRAQEARNKRIRYNLKVAVKTRDLERLPKAIADFKGAKLPDDDKDLEKGERILKEVQARDGLIRAMERRNLKELEGSISNVKRGGFEITLAKELIEANKVLLQLRRLERIRAEILELKQSTVAEIRSYQKPPPIVHTVMTATFLILGHTEKETQVWKTVQALVGKTGKDGLKRRCLGLEPDRIKPAAATRAKQLITAFGLDDVRDVSAGAATFYVWSETMIEELEARIASGEYNPNAPAKSEQKDQKPSGSQGPSSQRGRSRSVERKASRQNTPQSGGAKKPLRSKSSGK